MNDNPDVISAGAEDCRSVRHLDVPRREVVKSLATIPLASALIGCGSGTPQVVFSHGIASGDPKCDRVILWSRAVPLDKSANQAVVDWELARDAGFRSIVLSGTASAEAARDFIVKIDASGLQPNTAYFYRFLSDTSVSQTGQTKTLPSGNTDQIKFAAVCCANMPLGYFNAYRAVAERSDIDAVLHLGDYIYEYPRDRYGTKAVNADDRSIDPENELVSLSDYRSRYASYRLDPDLQAVHARHPFIAVWDDHDSANNSWRAGAKNHNDGEGDWAARKAASQQAWLEWLPVRETDFTANGRIYRTFDIGDLASLIMLDTRLVGRDQQLDYERDLEIDPDASAEETNQVVDTFRQSMLHADERTMLGFEQETWLTEQIFASKNTGQTWQIIAQQVVMGSIQVPPFDPGWVDPGMKPPPEQDGENMMAKLVRLGLPTNLDAWSGYPAARNRLLQDVAEHTNNAIVLSGDSHNAWACALSNDQRILAAEFAVQSVTSNGLEAYLPFNQDKIAASYVAANPELLWADTHNRGYMTVTLTHAEARAEWWTLDTVRDRQFNVTRARGMTVSATNDPGTGTMEFV